MLPAHMPWLWPLLTALLTTNLYLLCQKNFNVIPYQLVLSPGTTYSYNEDQTNGTFGVNLGPTILGYGDKKKSVVPMPSFTNTEFENESCTVFQNNLNNL